MARWTKAFPNYPTLYSFIEVADWTVHETTCTFSYKGGITSPYYWHVDGISCELGWWESGTYHPIDTGSANYNRSGGDVTVFEDTDFFNRWPDEDRVVYIYHEGKSSGTAYAEADAFTVPHLPGTPTNLTASWQTSTSILLRWVNPSTSYYAISIEVSVDGGEFTSCWYYDGAGYPVEYVYQNADQSHTYAFKCRVYWYGYGNYSNTATLEILDPLPPTPLTPTNGACVDIAGETVSFSWVHNPRSGCDQTGFKFKWKVNDGPYSTIAETSADSSYEAYLVSDLGASEGDTVEWMVATKGEAGDYSEFSTPMSFAVATAPTITIQRPGEQVAGMPIAYAARFDNAGYYCTAAWLYITLDGVEVYSEKCGISGGHIIAGNVSVTEFLPSNHEEYGLTIWASSSSGMEATKSASFTTSFIEPVEGSLEISNDPDTGYASLIASFDNDDEGADAVGVVVHRVNRDGTLSLVMEADESGATAVDKYAPLNTAYRYAVTTVSAEGATNTTYFGNLIRSDRWFVYWGDNTASAKWNPSNGGIQISRPQKTRVHYVGRKDPVSYDGSAVSLSETPSWMFVGQDEVLPFVRLIDDGGRGVYKSCDGWVYHADFDLTLNPSYTAIGYYGGATLSITRIAGRAL